MPDSFPAISFPIPVTGCAWIYILQSADGALYVGQARNLCERLRKHRFGIGAKFTSDHAGPRLVCHEGPMAFGAAIAREIQLKRWSRAKKGALISGDFISLRALSKSRE